MSTMNSMKTINESNVISFSNAMEKKQDTPLTALLKEISGALHQLLSNGNETIIDLNNTPCDLECEEALKEILGEGEVCASLTILGCDYIQETGIHGVWWVYHKNDTGAILTKALYISFVPSILPAQREDVEYGTTQLDRRLEKIGS